jgi:hypothetical protein
MYTDMVLQHGFYAEGWYQCLFRIIFGHITVLIIGHQFLTTVGQGWSQDSGGQSGILNIRGWYNRHFEATVLRNYLTPLLKSINSLKRWKLLTTPVILYYLTIQLQLHTQVKVIHKFLPILWFWHVCFPVLLPCLFHHGILVSIFCTIFVSISILSLTILLWYWFLFPHYLKSAHDAIRIYQDYVLEY